MNWELHSTVEGVERWESHTPVGYFVLAAVDGRWAESYFFNRPAKTLSVHFGPRSKERAQLHAQTCAKECAEFLAKRA